LNSKWKSRRKVSASRDFQSACRQPITTLAPAQPAVTPQMSCQLWSVRRPFLAEHPGETHCSRHLMKQCKNAETALPNRIWCRRQSTQGKCARHYPKMVRAAPDVDQHGITMRIVSLWHCHYVCLRRLPILTIAQLLKVLNVCGTYRGSFLRDYNRLACHQMNLYLHLSPFLYVRTDSEGRRYRHPLSIRPIKPPVKHCTKLLRVYLKFLSFRLVLFVILYVLIFLHLIKVAPHRLRKFQVNCFLLCCEAAVKSDGERRWASPPASFSSSTVQLGFIREFQIGQIVQ